MENDSLVYVVGETKGCSDTSSIMVLKGDSLQGGSFTCSYDRCSRVVQFINPLTSSSYRWLFGDMTTSEEASPAHAYATEDNYLVKLIIEPGTLCSDTIIGLVSLSDSAFSMVFVPNAFSPNGDQVNDKFEIRSNPDCRTYSMMIFNRWGQLIYRTEDALHEFWDGTTGAFADAESVFVYVLMDENGNKKRGHVSIIK